MRSDLRPLRAALTALALALSPVAISACAPRTASMCDPGRPCAEGAVCLSNNLCAVPDLTCTGSGYRYTSPGSTTLSACAPAQVVPMRDATAGEGGMDATLDVPVVIDVPPPRCTVAPPRLIAPLSPYRVVSQRPLVRYAVTQQLRSVELEFARTRDFARVVHTRMAPVELPDGGATATIPQMVSALPDGTEQQLAPGAWFWRARGVCSDGLRTEDSATWQFRVLANAMGEPLAVRNAATGLALPGGIDLNGDGRDDLVVGAPGRHSVFVYFGGASPSEPVEVQPNGEYRTAAFGALIANAGDVNGDGFGDVLVGSCSRRTNDFASACPGGFTVLLGGAGVITRDRVIDVRVPASVSANRAALALDGMGDLNSDGYGEVAVGNGNAFLDGSISAPGVVLFGSATGLGLSFLLPTEPNRGTAFAQSVAGTGVFDETGTPAVHLAVDSRVDRPAMFDAMGMRAAGYTATTSGPFGARGPVLAAAGDLDGDGRGDLVVANESPAVLMERVRATACFGTAPPGCVTLLTDNAFGSPERKLSLGGAGDVNGDGFDDVVFSVRAIDGSRPPELYLNAGGRPRAAVATRLAMCTRLGSETPAGYGVAVTIVGDFNGDGFDELAVSTNGTGGASGSDAGSASGDRVELFFGRATASLASLCESPTALPLPRGLVAGDRFGYALR